MPPHPQVPSHRWRVLPEVHERGHPWDPYRRQWFLQQHDWHGLSQWDPGMQLNHNFQLWDIHPIYSCCISTCMPPHVFLICSLECMWTPFFCVNNNGEQKEQKHFNFMWDRKRTGKKLWKKSWLRNTHTVAIIPQACLLSLLSTRLRRQKSYLCCRQHWFCFSWSALIGYLRFQQYSSSPVSFPGRHTPRTRLSADSTMNPSVAILNTQRKVT